MPSALAWTGGLGGIVVFVGAVWAIVRGLFKQVNATDDNTKALRELARQLKDLTTTVDSHSTDIAWLKGRAGRR